MHSKHLLTKKNLGSLKKCLNPSLGRKQKSLGHPAIPECKEALKNHYARFNLKEPPPARDGTIWELVRIELDLNTSFSLLLHNDT